MVISQSSWAWRQAAQLWTCGVQQFSNLQWPRPPSGPNLPSTWIPAPLSLSTLRLSSPKSDTKIPRPRCFASPSICAVLTARLVLELNCSSAPALNFDSSSSSNHQIRNNNSRHAASSTFYPGRQFTFGSHPPRVGSSIRPLGVECPYPYEYGVPTNSPTGALEQTERHRLILSLQRLPPPFGPTLVRRFSEKLGDRCVHCWLPRGPEESTGAPSISAQLGIPFFLCSFFFSRPNTNSARPFASGAAVGLLAVPTYRLTVA